MCTKSTYTTNAAANLIKAIAVNLILCLASCEHFLTLDPPMDQVTRLSVFQSERDAESALRGVYVEMMSQSGVFTSGGTGSIAVLTGLTGDELINHSTAPERHGFFNNGLDPMNNTIKQALWGHGYKVVYQVNALIEGVETAANFPEQTKRRLLGEAKFIRAFTHFYLFNLFGQVPYLRTTDYRVNNQAIPEGHQEFLEKIVADFTDAADLLDHDYTLSRNERIYPTAFAAEAMLARVYLYKEEWASAESFATKILERDDLFALAENPSVVFQKDSREAIWQLMPVVPGYNTWEGRILVLQTIPNNVALSERVLSWFEEGDQRKKAWTGSIEHNENTYYFPYKYKVEVGQAFLEYSMVLRLAEQLLIRAEALAHMGKPAEALRGLNLIRKRAGLGPLSGLSGPQVLEAIARERKVELFMEWGHRWLDLKRTGKIDQVMQQAKGNSWQSTDALFPIPLSELQLNRNLRQNTGY